MQLIPVIDLQAGQVVHAAGGNRAHYRPIRSVLVQGTRPGDVAGRLCEHCATTMLYLADLDALQGRAPQIDAAAALLDAQPALTVWLDAGFVEAHDIDLWMQRLGVHSRRVQPVLASESLASIAALHEAIAAWPQTLLSLDSRAGVPLDRGGVWKAFDSWPERLIAMDLARVGASFGPDIDHLDALRARSPSAWWIGSGGLRDDTDVARAEASGAQAWLVASALHAGRISARTQDLATATDCGGRDDTGHKVSRRDGPDTATASRELCGARVNPAEPPASFGMRFAPH